MIQNEHGWYTIESNIHVRIGLCTLYLSYKTTKWARILDEFAESEVSYHRRFGIIMKPCLLKGDKHQAKALMSQPFTSGDVYYWWVWRNTTYKTKLDTFQTANVRFFSLLEVLIHTSQLIRWNEIHRLP